MKIQVPLKFEAFKDGICEIYNVANNQLADKVETLHYDNRVVGAKRFFTAKSATVEISRIISVPMRHDICPKQNVVINGVRYQIEQVQQDTEKNPPATVLTLSRLGIAKRVT